MVSKSRKRHKKPKRSIPKQSFIMLGLVIILVGVFIYFRFMHGSAPGSNKSVVAYVNGEPVYYSELQELKSMAERTPYLSQAITEESLLDVLITQRLLKQAAKAAGIVVTEEEFNKTMEAYFQQTNLNKGNFTALLNSLGIPYESFKRDMINTLYLYKYINKTILPLINISNETLFNYYTSNLESFTQPEMVYAAHILVNSSELAEELLNKINQGANFTELAKNYSQGYMAPMGGVLGWFTRDKFPKEFTDVAFSLDIGEVSDVVKTDYGWHIIKVLNKSEPKVMDFSEVRSWIELTLKAQQQGELLNQRIAELKEKAKIQILLETNTTSSSSTKDIGSFRDTGSGGECFENGKPVIRLFTTSTCPHCRWVKPGFINVVNRYKDRVVAYLWELDTGDNLLTDEIETKVPDEEMAIYHKFNPQRSVPTFVFGCRYVRVGTVYEAQNDLTKEEADFQKVIEALLTQ